MSVLGNRIRYLRKFKGLNQEQLAEALNKQFEMNIDRVMISKWETGFQTPVMSSIICLARFFNVSIDFLNGNESSQDETNYIEKQLVYSFEGKGNLKTAEQHLDITKIGPLNELHLAASELSVEQIKRLSDIAKDMSKK